MTLIFGKTKLLARVNFLDIRAAPPLWGYQADS